MNRRVALLVLVFSVGGFAACDSKRSENTRPGSPIQLTDLPTLDVLRRDFNAHKQEARFLMLLAPT